MPPNIASHPIRVKVEARALPFDGGPRRFSECTRLGKQEFFVYPDRARAHRFAGEVGRNMRNRASGKAFSLIRREQERLIDR